MPSQTRNELHNLRETTKLDKRLAEIDQWEALQLDLNHLRTQDIIDQKGRMRKRAISECWARMITAPLTTEND